MPKDWKVGIVTGFVLIALAIVFFSTNPQRSNKTASLEKHSEAVSYDKPVKNSVPELTPNSNDLSKTLVTPAPIKLTSSQDRQGPLEPERPSKPIKIYTVKKGDSLSSISEKFYRDKGMWHKIRDANKIKNVNSLSTGTKLIIP